MRTTTWMLIGLLAVAGACAKKKDGATPLPPPARSSADAATGGGDAPGAAGDAATNPPGSAEAFRAAATDTMVRFGYDSYELDAAARAILDSQSAWLTANPAVRFTVEGHADERGTREYNLALGERRADAVRTYLAGKGVAAERMTIVSYGKERPLAGGSDEAAWANNRRAATTIGGPTG